MNNPIITLPDLGTTLMINPDGSVTISLGWLGHKIVTPAEALKIRSWFNENLFPKINS